MPAKAKLVTRQATTSSVTADNLNKGSALEFAELDSNLINLRDQTFGVVADDSSTIDIAAGGTLYIQGGTNVTTSTNSDGTITINSTGGSAALGNITGSGDTLSSSGSTINLDDPVTISTAGSSGTNIGNIARFNSGTSGVDFNQQGDLSGSFFIYGDRAQQAGHDKPFEVAFAEDNTVKINGYKMPEDDGANGQIIKTDGSNTLSFTVPLKVVGDDSAAVDIMAGGTLYIQGGTNVTTATNSDGTITINSTAAGTITALNNQAENRLTTIGSTTTQLDGEANLTFDGSTLSLTGQANIDFVQIKDNKITTNATNADLQISANGTGQIQFSPNDASVDDVFSTNTRYDFGANRIFSEQNADANSIFSDSGDRRYANGDFVSVSLGSSSSNPHARWRSGTFSLIDMKGFDIDSSTQYYKGINTRYVESNAKNTSTSTASTLNNISGVYSSINTTGTDSGAGLTIDSAYNFVSDIFLSEGSSETVALTDAYHFATKGSGGGGAITDEYGFYVDGLGGTNKYGFYTNDDSYINSIGGVTLQNGTISTDGISIVDNEITASRSNDDLEISANGTGQIKTSAALIGVGSQTGGNIILTDQADGSFQTAQYASPGMLNPSGLQVDSAGSFKYSQLILNNFSLNANNALWATRSRSNTHGTNAYLEQGDVIFQFFGAGWNGAVDGSGYFSGNAIVDLFASEDHDINNRGGGINFQTINTGAASGSTTKMEITDNVVVKNPKAATQAALAVEGSIRLKNTSDPSNVTDCAHIFAKDDGSTSEVYVRDEAGNETKISPHNQSGQWEYYSKNINTGKVFRVNMEKMIRKLEDITGETFIESV